MKKYIHVFAGITATSCIALFWFSSVIVEIFGSLNDIAMVKHLIVYPGLFILIPCIIATGGSGFVMGKKFNGPIVAKKKKRMPIIALNGLFILMPAAIFLDSWAAQGLIDTRFFLLQAVEYPLQRFGTVVLVPQSVCEKYERDLDVGRWIAERPLLLYSFLPAQRPVGVLLFVPPYRMRGAVVLRTREWERQRHDFHAAFALARSTRS